MVSMKLCRQVNWKSLCAICKYRISQQSFRSEQVYFEPSLIYHFSIYPNWVIRQNVVEVLVKWVSTSATSIEKFMYRSECIRIANFRTVIQCNMNEWRYVGNMNEKRCVGNMNLMSCSIGSAFPSWSSILVISSWGSNFGICAGNILLAATLMSSRGIQQICRFLHKMAHEKLKWKSNVQLFFILVTNTVF